ncbi:bifunctional 4-hydroxy-2-oxoglutarate aldolase/2-dehydro-3-deoxy-phosphogluconate aldolase [Streptomyces griseorubiginosus]|uniref:bifunctional 4-hydroxy-2-oxoglutarate aldolase/2-dehydro-3-deoxy-phosphogluconate aldolase n=1 Tax=Streptomyces griseorubiginosus TaxID=67304 RepID=UPI00113FC660|nr:bifunctional 4-hydroxy-2-oxoglutarate aldolase/2-dehydro-3-deoxy-phosphogluconate aldolase [Streptomyces griseorubiginosus]
MTGTDLAELLAQARIVPVLTVPDPRTAAPLARALTAGGAHCAEVTFRTPDAEEVVKAMAAEGGLVVGAGTILTAEQAERAVAAGARFLVSPGLDDEVLDVARALGVPIAPGVATATELMRAVRAGIDTVKLFPSEPLGGRAMLRALAAPFPGVRFMPTGGIGPAQLPGYLSEPAVLAVGGSWMATPALLASGDYEEIRRLTAEAVERSTP